jgi:DNA invertase Pin-like site-specific DNA recombinase
MQETLHIYTRVSTAAQEEDGTSLDNQRETGIQKAEALGMIPQIWNEGASSSSGDDLTSRPVITELMTKVNMGEVKHLFVWNTDRLSRNIETWGFIRLSLVKSGVTLHTPTGRMELNDPQTNFMLGVLSEVSQYDNLLRAERFRSGKLRRIREGGWMGGPPPFGYTLSDSKLVVHPEEAEIVRFIFNCWNNLDSAETISTKLLSMGVLTRRGNTIWSRGSIEKLLTNTHYIGSYTFRDKKTGEVINCICDSIIEPEVWTEKEKVRAKRSRSTKERVRSKKQVHPYLLLGMIQCGHCGSLMSGQRKSAQKSYYSCLKKSQTKFRDQKKQDFVPCSNPRNLRMDLTDVAVLESVLSTLENSVIFKETVKEAKLKNQSFKKSVKAAEKNDDKIRRIESKLQTIDLGLEEYLTSSVLNGLPSATVKKFMLQTENKKQELLSEVRKLEAEKTSLEKGRVWIDWVSEFGDLIETMRNEETSIEVKHDFLSEVIESISVTEGEDQTSRFEIKFTIPVVHDELKWNDPTNKSRGYELRDGSNKLVFSSSTQVGKGQESPVPKMKGVRVNSVTVE